MMFKWIQRGFTVLACGLLVFLFLVPGPYLTSCEKEISALCDDAVDALLAEDSETASIVWARLLSVFDQRSRYLKWYLDNASVGEVEHGIELAGKQITAGDTAGAIVTLIGIKHNMSYLLGLERFTWNTVL
ncbi:MAG: DUF4363 family protein [Clostridiales bacterium]|nr:DUF4363 family protein [Clostridiales bacterium]